jgi:platelet-activating factor acetylhydrolase
MPPVLVLNSPGFTIWTSHFSRLVKMAKAAKGSITLITVMNGNRESSGTAK